jgi:hypothetical protein
MCRCSFTRHVPNCPPSVRVWAPECRHGSSKYPLDMNWSTVLPPVASLVTLIVGYFLGSRRERGTARRQRIREKLTDIRPDTDTIRAAVEGIARDLAGREAERRGVPRDSWRLPQLTELPHAIGRLMAWQPTVPIAQAVEDMRNAVSDYRIVLHNLQQAEERARNRAQNLTPMDTLSVQKLESDTNAAFQVARLALENVDRTMQRVLQELEEQAT